MLRSVAKQSISELIADRWLSASGETRSTRARITFSEGVIENVEPLSFGHSGRDVFAMPALANAHDHGRGLRPLSYGAFDQPLETWFTALNVHPPVDPYINAACAFARMAQSGIGLAVHCHTAVNDARLIETAGAVCRAAEDVGIRLAFVVPMRDRDRLGYLSDDAVIRRLPSTVRAAIQKRWLGTAVLPAEEQIAVADEIARRYSSGLVDVLYGPAAPHWCTNRMLELVAAASDRTGRRVHMHCLETRYQREFADSAYPQGLFPYLKSIGMLSDRLTLAHGVYLRPDEMDMIADANAIVSLNTCSNLRLRSGIAPAKKMAAHGVQLAIGIDALGFDDEEDGLRELRLTYLLHAGVSFDEGLDKATLITAALRNGARAVTGRTNHGALRLGMAADLVVLNFSKLAHDVLPGVTPDLDVILARATSRCVRHLIVGGFEIVRDGRVLGIDRAALEVELVAQATAASHEYITAKPLLEILQTTLRQCYLDGLHRDQRSVANHPQLSESPK
jgi:cytosine/adenosine deaminase-related metal-dependent hydrolase